MRRAAGGAEPVELRAQPASELVWRLANAGFAARCLQVVAELGVADRIDEAPVPVAALGSSCAVDIDALERLERDVLQASAEVGERPVVTKLPDITLKELLIVFKDALDRSTMFAHHHVRKEPLSVRERMSTILVTLQSERYVDFQRLFDPAEGRIGVTVTFLAILELVKESLVDIVQAEAFGPIHIRASQVAPNPDEISADPIHLSATDEQYNG